MPRQVFYAFWDKRRRLSAAKRGNFFGLLCRASIDFSPSPAPDRHTSLHHLSLSLSLYAFLSLSRQKRNFRRSLPILSVYLSPNLTQTFSFFSHFNTHFLSFSPSSLLLSFTHTHTHFSSFLLCLSFCLTLLLTCMAVYVF